MSDKERDQELELEDDDEIIILHNEITDKDEEFYNLATLDVDDRWFVILKPTQKLPDIAEDEVLIYEIAPGEDGVDTLVPIEDEDLLMRVYDEFERELARYEEGCDGDCCDHDCCDGDCHHCD